MIISQMQSYLKLALGAFLLVSSATTTAADSTTTTTTPAPEIHTPPPHENCPTELGGVEVYVLMDGTNSFKDFVEGSRLELAYLVADLHDIYKPFEKTKAGLGFFGGYQNQRNPGSDTCFRQGATLTDQSPTFYAAAERMTTFYNDTGLGDENILEPLVWLAGSGAGFSKPTEDDNVVRILLTITDAWGLFNGAGGYEEAETPPNPDLMTDLKCGPDYPLRKQVGDALRETKVYPLVLTTDNGSAYRWNLLFDYANGIPQNEYSVIQIENDPSKIKSTVLDAIQDLVCSVHYSTTTTTSTKDTTMAAGGGSGSGAGGSNEGSNGGSGSGSAPGGSGSGSAPGGSGSGLPGGSGSGSAPGGSGSESAPGGSGSGSGTGGSGSGGSGSGLPGGSGSGAAPGGSGSGLPGGSGSGSAPGGSGSGGSGSGVPGGSGSGSAPGSSGSDESSNTTPIVVGAAAGGATLAAAGGALAFKRFSSDEPHLEADFEEAVAADEDRDEEVRRNAAGRREVDNPTGSMDYGEYGV